MTRILLSIALFLTTASTHAQPEGITWQQTIGGEDNEWIGGIVRGNDGAYVACGYTTSTEGVFSQNQGGYDMFVSQFSSLGEPMQFITLGSSGYDEANDLVALPTGGYAVIGIVSEDNGDITAPVFGANDAWLGVFDDNLLLINQLSFGGNLSEEGTALITTEDGGLLLTGRTSSTNGALGAAYGQDDIFLIKLAADLSIEWTNTYGGSEWDRPADLAETSTGYVVTGSSASSDNDVASNQGGLDIWVFEVSPSGELLWSSSFGGTSSDAPESIAIDQNQNIIVAGHSNSDDGDVIGNIGGRDGLVLTFSANGTLLDQDHFGTNLDDFFYDIYIESDGSKTCVGLTNASVQLGGLGGSDYYLVKLNTSNEVVWQEIYGGSLADGGYHILPDADGYLLAGEHYSSDGDITTHYGARDVSILRLGEVVAVSGCTDASACNYNPLAVIDDGSCEFVIAGEISGDILPSTFSEHVYTYPSTAGSTYQWSAVNGVISSGQGSNEVTVYWVAEGTGSLSVQETTATNCLGDVITLNIIVTPVDVPQLSAAKLRIFPNPANEQLFVKGNTGSAEYFVHNSMGQLVLHNQATGDFLINTSQLATGTYQLTVILRDQASKHPFIVTH